MAQRGRPNMGILTRIVKVMAALMTSNVVNLITKLLLPPIFLFRYGTTLYGEWIALSGAVAYLSTLNFGIQTYVTQDLTVRYQRHELGRYHLQQSTSLRVLVGILGSAAVLYARCFCAPGPALVAADSFASGHFADAVFLALQVLLGVLFGYFTGMFMVLEPRPYRCVLGEWTRLTMVLVTSSGAWLRCSFPVLAGLQASVYVLGNPAGAAASSSAQRPKYFPQIHLVGWRCGRRHFRAEQLLWPDQHEHIPFLRSSCADYAARSGAVRRRCIYGDADHLLHVPADAECAHAGDGSGDHATVWRQEWSD